MLQQIIGERKEGERKEGERKEGEYNNEIQIDFITKLKKRYLSADQIINPTDDKVKILRTDSKNLSRMPTEEDVKNMLKTRLHKKISGSEHAEWESAKYKTMEERIAMGEEEKMNHGKQGEKVKGLNDFEHCALFLLNESNYCYNAWLKFTFLNYLSSNKKQWTDSNKKGLGKEEIDKQLNFFKKRDNYKISPKGKELSPIAAQKTKAFAEGIGFKGYIAPENEYLLRMIFIDNMIKGIELFYHLLVVAPDKLMRDGPDEQSKRRKEERKDLLASAGVDANFKGEGEDFLEWGKKGIARGQGGGFLTKTGCWVVTKVAFCAFMWAIVSNNFAEKIDNFLPEMEHLFQVNFRDYTPRIASEFSETRTEFTKIMLEYSGDITNGKGDIMFVNSEGVTKVPPANIRKEMKKRNAEHLKEIITLKEIIDEKHKQTIGIIKALPSPEIVSGSSSVAIITPEEHASKKDELVKKLENRKRRADKVFIEQQKMIEDGRQVANPTISVSYGHITQICGESAWSMVFTDSQDHKTDAISDIESRIIAAMGRDGANIISKRIIASRESTSSQGNKAGLGAVADTAANLFAYFWKGNDARYINAPGMGDSLDQAKRRIKLIRKDVRNWEESIENATNNFIKDVLLHIRNTSYWFWIYFTFMSALEIYAIRSILKFIPGTAEYREQERQSEFGEGGRLLSRKMLACCRKVRTEEISSTITAWEDRGISGIGDATSLVVHEHTEARRRGVRWVVKGVKYMLIVALFRGIAESMRMALGKPKQPYTFTFNDIMKPTGGYIEDEYNTGDVFKFDTRIPKTRNPTPRYYTPMKNEKGDDIPTKKKSERNEEDNIETIYVDDNLYTENDDDTKGSMVAFTYQKMEGSSDDKDSEPKYHIVGMSFPDTPLEGQLAHIRRVTEPDMKRSAIAPIGLSRASSDGQVDFAIDLVGAPPNVGDWRTLNGISINDGDNEIRRVLEEQDKEDNEDVRQMPPVKKPNLKLSTNGGRKKRKRKKTRRKKRKGGRKKTKKKRKRRKTRRKRKKLRRKKTRRKR